MKMTIIILNLFIISPLKLQKLRKAFLEEKNFNLGPSDSEVIPTTTQVLTVLELMEDCKATVIINVLLSMKDFEGGILLMNNFKILL